MAYRRYGSVQGAESDNKDLIGNLLQKSNLNALPATQSCTHTEESYEVWTVGNSEVTWGMSDVFSVPRASTTSPNTTKKIGSARP